MKAYTLHICGIEPGIYVGTDANRKIRVGESGRNRKLVEVPVPAESLVSEKGFLLEVSSQKKEDSALVLIKNQSGFRGGWRMSAPAPIEQYISVLQEHRERHNRTDCGWNCPVVLGRALGTGQPAVKVVAEGWKAQGLAGNMGGGPEYLIVWPFGQTIEIERRGRFYRNEPRVVQVTLSAQGVRIIDPWAEAEVSASQDALAKILNE
ncbi:MAG: hypothetical protein KatS3mg087_1344 [Patescibacteria group bacterium]|nr:MAG: hypothetical protein KatS3mg087_1344 [Patescibacteria group bacterium]